MLQVRELISTDLNPGFGGPWEVGHVSDIFSKYHVSKEVSCQKNCLHQDWKIAKMALLNLSMKFKNSFAQVFKMDCPKKSFLETRISIRAGQFNFSGQSDKSFFIVPGQRDNGTSSKSGPWFLTDCPVPSCGTKSKNFMWMP